MIIIIKLPSLFSLVPRFFFSLNNDAHSVIISAAQSQISEFGTKLSDSLMNFNVVRELKLMLGSLN